jgi:hypothetical protein
MSTLISCHFHQRSWAALPGCEVKVWQMTLCTPACLYFNLSPIFTFSHLLSSPFPRAETDIRLTIHDEPNLPHGGVENGG